MNQRTGRTLLVGVCALVLLVVLGPYTTIYDPKQTEPAASLQPPSVTHWLGTDELGRDLWSRTVHGTRRTLVLSSIATFVIGLVALPIGIVAGYFRGPLATLGTALVDILLVLPPLVIALVLLTVAGNGAGPLIMAVALGQVGPFARVVRDRVQTIRVEGYIEATRAMGGREAFIMREHVLRALRPSLITYLILTFAYATLNSAALEFLGLGGDPAVPSWGNVLADSRRIFRVNPWAALVPGVALALWIGLLNRFADALSRGVGSSRFPVR